MICVFKRLVTVDQISYRMWAIFEGEMTMQKTLAALGPQELKLNAATLREHAYHHPVGKTPLALVRHTRHCLGDQQKHNKALFVKASGRGNYLYAYFAPDLAAAVQLFGTGPVI